MRELSRQDRRFSRAYLKALRKEAAERSSFSQVEKLAEAQWREDGSLGEDPASRGHHWAACLALASDQVLSSQGVPDVKRRQAIETAVVKPGSWFVKLATRLLLMMPGDTFRMLKRYTENQVPPRYGPTFAFETAEDTHDTFVQAVTRCFYNDYFRARGKPELIGAFCAFDRLWIDQIDEQRDGVRFERPCTLAGGSACCRFEFYRAEID